MLRYHEARVSFRHDCADTVQGREDITHEVLHAAMGEQRLAVGHIIALVPAALQDVAWEFWTDANERVVTQLARGLTPLLDRVDLKES